MAATTGGLLTVLSTDERAPLRAAGQRRRWPKGRTLFCDGDQSDTVLLVERGQVKLSRFDEHGDEDVLAILEPGELLGELAAVDGEPRSATATALDDVEAFVVSADTFREVMAASPEVAAALLRTITFRLRAAGTTRVELARADTVQRVARRIVELAERFAETDDDGAIRITLPLSQEELAAWAGASREAVVKALKILRDRGLIETRRREIRVLDLAGLEKKAR